MDGREKKFVRTVAIFVAAVGVLYIARLVALALTRVGYPYQLEWVEGGVLEHVRRVLDGKPIYAAPSLEFISFIYPPFYYWVSAAAAWVMGFGFAPLRLVSLVSTLATMAIMADMVRRETGDLRAGLIAAGLYAASYDVTDRWMDLGRVDALFICLTLSSVYVLHYFGERKWCAVAAGALASFAVLTKQSAAVALGPVMLFEFAARPRRVWPALVSAAVVTGVIAGWLIWRSHGWFLFYALRMPASHGIMPAYLIAFWRLDLWQPIPIAITLAVAAPALVWRRRGWAGSCYYVLLSSGFIVAAWLARMKVGGWINCDMPAYAAISILAGITIGLAVNEPRAARIAPVLLLAVGVQFWYLHRPESRAIPTAEDRAAAKLLENVLLSFPGEVYVPGSGYLEARLGKKSYAHSAAFLDLLTSDSDRAKQMFLNELEPALKGRRFDAIILNSSPESYLFEKELKANYYEDHWIFSRLDAFQTRSGLIMRPEFVWLPRKGNK